MITYLEGRGLCPQDFILPYSAKCWKKSVASCSKWTVGQCPKVNFFLKGLSKSFTLSSSAWSPREGVSTTDSHVHSTSVEEQRASRPWAQVKEMKKNKSSILQASQSRHINQILKAWVFTGPGNDRTRVRYKYTSTLTLSQVSVLWGTTLSLGRSRISHREGKNQQHLVGQQQHQRWDRCCSKVIVLYEAWANFSCQNCL